MIERITSSRFLRNVLIVASGTAGAQIITLAFSPVITRLYGPEAFGLLGTFLATLAILMPIAALTYPIAIVLPEKDRDARRLAQLSALLATAISLFVLFLVLTASGLLTATFGLKALDGFLLLIPLAMFFAAGRQIFEQLLIRGKQFRPIARVAVAQSLTLNIAKTGAGWLLPVGGTLIVLATAGQALHSLFLLLGVRARTRRGLAEPASIKEPESPIQTEKTLWELARIYSDFPLFRAPQVMINGLSQGLPVLMLASFSGPAAAGFYSLGKTVLGAPVLLLGKSVGDVFYPRVVEAVQKKDPVLPLLLKATALLAGVGFLPFLLVIAFGPWLFSFVFGAGWEMAGEYARWLSLWLFFGFLNRPSVMAIQTLGLQHLFLMYEIASVVVRVLALYTGFVMFESDLVAVALFSLAGVILNSFLIGLVMYKSARPLP